MPTVHLDSDPSATTTAVATLQRRLGAPTAASLRPHARLPWRRAFAAPGLEGRALARGLRGQASRSAAPWLRTPTRRLRRATWAR
eukprot:6773697-Alexandrium_andersonii.AAC.1